VTDQAIIEAPRAAPGTLLPVLNPGAAREAYQAYLELCQAILVPYDKRIVRDGVVVQESDYARIPVRRQVSGRWVTEYVDAPKKSAWRKLARFYGVSTEIVEKHRETHPDGSYTWHYTVRASAGGVSTDGEGSCTSTEKGGRSEHETRATAHTRAKSRAISDLIGFGQVSAEEYGTYEGDLPPKPVEAAAVVTQTPEEPRAEPRPEPGMKVKPEAAAAEDTVRATLAANGLDTGSLLIYRYANVVRVEPQPGSEDQWEKCDRVIKLLKGTWIDDQLSWEVPAEHLAPPVAEPSLDIWAAEWKVKGGDPAPRDAAWAWAFAYTRDGDYLPETRALVKHLEQHGAYEADGYTVTLGGRDKNLLNLKKNKEAKP